MPQEHFTIQHPGRNTYERTVVGNDGQTHIMQTDKPGRDGDFTDEGKYRRAIDQAVRENNR